MLQGYSQEGFSTSVGLGRVKFPRNPRGWFSRSKLPKGGLNLNQISGFQGLKKGFLNPTRKVPETKGWPPRGWFGTVGILGTLAGK